MRWLYWVMMPVSIPLVILAMLMWASAVGWHRLCQTLGIENRLFSFFGWVMKEKKRS
jgi:hypothetical protein